MRAVIQRVQRATVTVDGKTTGRIGPGLLVFLGVGCHDDEKDLRYIVRKTAGLRVFEDQAGKMNLSVLDAGGAVLAVPQFTLYGDCRKGRRPSFTAAGAPQDAEQLYLAFVKKLRQRGIEVETGSFQEHMEVSLVNDGPVTMLLDSSKLF
jgi:D-tyrosyl-tRNA(Tyr) deacylase